MPIIDPGTLSSEDELQKEQLPSLKSKKRKRGGKEVLREEDGARKKDDGETWNTSFAFDSFGASSRGPVKQDIYVRCWINDKELTAHQSLSDSLELFKRKNQIPRVNVDDLIARRKTQAPLDDESEASFDEEDIADEDEPDEDEPDEDEEAEEDDLPDEDDEEAAESELDGGFAALADEGDDGLESAEEDELSMDEAEPVEDDYFAPAPTREVDDDAPKSFTAIPGARLSRPILLALSSLSLSVPTPIQVAALPVVLLGKDIVASSVTGSGKTVAYWLGVLERLLHRDRKEQRTRVVCLCPTRELAVQVIQVGKALARYTDITFCLCVGGLSLKSQEAELRQHPDIVVATPGRLIDHVRNTASFALDGLEILIIDEADRILEEGFRDELSEIIDLCPRSRSTLLFSATITEDVNELARLSLDKPVRLKTDILGAASSTLTQEFLRVRDDRSNASTDLKAATLVAVCRRAFRGRTIIFFRSKAAAHRMKIVFGLAGLTADELHGDLSQEQRLTALDRFRQGAVDYLLATDLASRGLDIKGVENVINYESPASVEVYLHRVGRTARAGKQGRALTLVGEADRKLVKQAIKHAPSESVKQRVVPPEFVKSVLEELAGMQEDIEGILEEEVEEKELRRTEMELRKGQNLIDHDSEIKARPPRTWFSTEKDKKVSKTASLAQHNSKFDEPEKKERRPNHKQRRRIEARKEDPGVGAAASIKATKRANQALATTGARPGLKKQDKTKAKSSKPKKTKSSFSADLTAPAKRSRPSPAMKGKTGPSKPAGKPASKGSRPTGKSSKPKGKAGPKKGGKRR